MAIEHHPKFAEWAQALDKLTAAKDVLQTAVAFGEGEAIIEAARRAVILAQAEFWKACDEIE